MIVVKWRSDPGAPGPVAAGGGGTSSSGDWEVSGVDPQSARTELRPRVKRGVRVKLLQGLTKLRDLEVPFSPRIRGHLCPREFSGHRRCRPTLGSMAITSELLAKRPRVRRVQVRGEGSRDEQECRRDGPREGGRKGSC